MNAAVTILRIIVGMKELRIVFWIMLFLVLLPAMTVAVIADSPKEVLESIFGKDPEIDAYIMQEAPNTNIASPVPTGIEILGGFYYPGDLYAPGNCTYWVYARRAQVGKAIPNSWGNANTWDDRARDDGRRVDHVPEQYAIAQTDRGELGHVTFVERVNPDGSWYLSEMNARGLYVVSHRDMPASTAANFNFIH